MWTLRRLAGWAGAATVVGGAGACVARLDRVRRPDEASASHTYSMEAALPLLVEGGHVVVEHAIAADAVSRIRQTDAYQSGMRIRAAYEYPTAEWRQSELGRFHRVKFSELDAAAFGELEESFRPLVEQFFGAASAPRVYRSECQLITAVPGGTDQKW